VTAGAWALLVVAAVPVVAVAGLLGARFLRWAPVVIMVTYHLGQAGLTLSLVHG